MFQQLDKWNSKNAVYCAFRKCCRVISAIRLLFLFLNIVELWPFEVHNI